MMMMRHGMTASHLACLHSLNTQPSSPCTHAIDKDRVSLHQASSGFALVDMHECGDLLAVRIRTAFSSSTSSSISSSIQVMGTSTMGSFHGLALLLTAFSVLKEGCCHEMSEAHHKHDKSKTVDDEKRIDCLALIAPVPNELLEKKERTTTHVDLSIRSAFPLGRNSRISPSFGTTQVQWLLNAANRSRPEIVSSPPPLLHQEEEAAMNLGRLDCLSRLGRRELGESELLASLAT
jgi:hypothetical protein